MTSAPDTIARRPNGQFDTVASRPEPTGLLIRPTSPSVPDPTSQIDWHTADLELSEAQQELVDGMQRLHAISPASQTEARWIADDTFTCDGGSVAVALMARELGIPAQLHVGLYWHSDVELRAQLMGEYRDDETDEEWQQNLDSIRADAMDDHHHWVTLHPGAPNEMRGEQALVIVSGLDEMHQNSTRSSATGRGSSFVRVEIQERLHNAVGPKGRLVNDVPGREAGLSNMDEAEEFNRAFHGCRNKAAKAGGISDWPEQAKWVAQAADYEAVRDAAIGRMLKGQPAR